MAMPDPDATEAELKFSGRTSMAFFRGDPNYVMYFMPFSRDA